MFTFNRLVHSYTRAHFRVLVDYILSQFEGGPLSDFFVIVCAKLDCRLYHRSNMLDRQVGPRLRTRAIKLLADQKSIVCEGFLL